MSVRYLSALLVLLPVLLLARAAAAAEPEYSLTISDHRFQPERLEIPAGQKIRLVVENRDATPEEFESYDLNVEKVITGNQKAALYIGPLDAGTYEFFGEFHSDTARGHIVAK